MSPEIITALIVLAILVSSPVFLVLWIRGRKKTAKAIADLKNTEHKFSGITDIDAEIKRRRNEAEEELRETKNVLIGIEADIALTKRTYGEKKAYLDELNKELFIYEDRVSFARLGVYEPHFEFNDSEIYKKHIKSVRDSQKVLISGKGATVCDTDWEVGGSRAEGRRMVDRQSKLTLRAFNGECDAAIANTRWNNIVAMEKRIRNAANQINKVNASVHLTITNDYIDLKIKELYLTHEYREQLKIEKDNKAEAARTAREEKKLLADALKAEKEEQKYEALLEQARKEAASGETTEAMQQKIQELEKALKHAHEATERAQAMAERTKSGYVYVISNIGSFGEDMVKIGLTRRLDPDDRVRELGDASVPFVFDTHAMIYSDEAPALEAALHKEFDDRRVNTSNMRKEFFRVSLEEVEAAVAKLAPTASFFKDREAQEWHETMARRNELLQQESTTEIGSLPASI